MKILISGANGFIGKNLLKALDQPGNSIFAFVRNRSKIRPEQISKNVIFFEADLAKTSSYIREVRDFNPEIVFHLAWDGIPDLGLRNSIKSLNMSKFFLKTIISETNCSKIIITGSCLEYGCQVGKCYEYQQTKVVNDFVWAKNALREWIFQESIDANFNIAWLRIFYVYGPGQRSGSLIPSVIEEISESGNIPTIKNFDNANDFIYIDDLIDLMELLVEKNFSTNIFNVGSGYSSSVKSIIKEILKIFNMNEIQINTNKAQKGSIDFYADINKAQEILGWRPKTNITEGILKTCKYICEKNK